MAVLTALVGLAASSTDALLGACLASVGSLLLLVLGAGRSGPRQGDPHR